MKLLIPCALVFVTMPGLAQKMYETGEWCAENKSHSSAPILLGPDGRSDSIDLTHAWITLDLSSSSSQFISGNCRWAFTPKMEQVSELRFDLLGLNVDSVLLGSQKVNFSRFASQIIVPIANPFPVNSVQDVSIFYSGNPQKDASGWGGFYFDGSYAFNLGVGFAADPHVFGRAWFPCFDNFVERSTYTFDIVTTPSQPAYCNGTLLADENTPSGKRRRVWLLNQSIPSYLACVAIGPYTSFKRVYPGANNPIPVDIAAAAADTNNVRNTFQHLPQAIAAFEYWYGPYKWPRIGFSLVPFGSGAMEHATNVAIGRAFINGTLSYETLWAHELSHHWWGDLATCTTAEDMWLNEGWASYSEHLFTEWQYGKTAYQNAVRSNFLDVLQTAHVGEGGYLAVSGVPHSLTYGKHVYNKGAVVAHNLRGYMGDSLFRSGIRHALENTSFTDWDSGQFRDMLEEGTGLDLDAFFENWVFSGGFTDFLIDSSQISDEAPGKFLVKLFVRQKLRGAPEFFEDVPLEFSFLTDTHERVYKTAVLGGEHSELSFVLDFKPKFVFVNTNLRLTLARGDGEKSIKATGTVNFSEAKMALNVNTLGADSVLVRIEHHFATPDNAGANPNGFMLSNRFWQVAGDFPSGFDAQATVTYDGRGQLDQLDKELFDSTSPSEDSIVLLYRPGAGHAWQIWPNYSKITLASTTDKLGQLRIQQLQPGQYTIGKGVTSSATHNPASLPWKLLMSPNPSTGSFVLDSDVDFEFVQIVNAEGVLLKEWSFNKSQRETCSIEELPSGIYWVIVGNTTSAASTQIIKI